MTNSCFTRVEPNTPLIHKEQLSTMRSAQDVLRQRTSIVSQRSYDSSNNKLY